MNRQGSEYSCIQGNGYFDGPVDDAAIASIAAWNVNVVRVPLNLDCYLGTASNAAYSGSGYQQQILAFVQRLNNADLNVILDLHWTDSGSNGSA